MQPTINRCIYCGKEWVGSDSIVFECDKCKETYSLEAFKKKWMEDLKERKENK